MLGAALCHAAAEAGDPPERGLEQRLQVALDAIRSSGNLPGVTAAVARPDHPLLRISAGFADLESREPMPRDAVMPAGSIGKQFLAMVALALEHTGRVDLDAPIAGWLSDEPWFGHVPNANSLTLRLLLSHRGGLPDHRDDPRFHAAVKQRFDRRPYDPEFRIAPEELMGYIGDASPLFAAGAGFRYSETGYILAGLALERACGCVYYEELSRLFLRPLNLRQTAPALRRWQHGLVQGYIGSHFPEFPQRTMEDGKLRFSPATEWTGGGLFSSAGDLARWSLLVYEGRAASWPYLDELLARVPPVVARVPPVERGDRTPAPQEATFSEPHYPYGLGVRIWSTALGTAYGHGGEFPGYLSLTIYFTDYHTAIALQTNTAASSADFLKGAAIELMRVALAFERAPRTEKRGAHTASNHADRGSGGCGW